MKIENEYGPQALKLGAAGKAYANWAAKMAVGLDTGVPWVMCKEDDAPDPVVSYFINLVKSCKDILSCFLTLNHFWQINACNGFYCDTFTPNKPYKPIVWTEAWSGW